MQPTLIKTPAAPTWKPVTAGILIIINGIGGIFACFFFLLMGLVILNAASWADFTEQEFEAMSIGLPAAFFVVLAVCSLIFGIISLVGGIFALKRKLWGLALTGSIVSTLTGSLMGILALIFLAMSKEEFT